jgi:hypothetical protein
VAIKEESLNEDKGLRDGTWTESFAVGSEAFVTATKGEGRSVMGGDGSFELRESPAAYRIILGHENGALRPENEYFWKISA